MNIKIPEKPLAVTIKKESRYKPEQWFTTCLYPTERLEKWCKQNKYKFTVDYINEAIKIY